MFIRNDTVDHTLRTIEIDMTVLCGLFFFRFSVVIMPFFLIKSCHLVRNHEIHHKVIRDFKVVLNRPILPLTRYILFLPPLSNDVMWFSLQILYFI